MAEGGVCSRVRPSSRAGGLLFEEEQLGVECEAHQLWDVRRAVC